MSRSFILATLAFFMTAVSASAQVMIEIQENVGVFILGGEAAAPDKAAIPQISAPVDNIVTADWLYSRPQQTKIVCIVPSDFSAPPRLLLTDPKYINDLCVHGSPSWSPDGRRIAFNVQRSSEQLTDARMITVNFDGSDVKDLGLGLMPNYSADGKQITFCGYEAVGRVCIMNADGSQRQGIPNADDGWGSQWSPDGRWIAFHRYTSPPQITLYEVATGQSRDLIPNAKNPYLHIFWNMAWSPDSRKIAFLANSTNDYSTENYDCKVGVVSIDADAFQVDQFSQTQLVHPHIDFSRDGKQLLYPQDGCLLVVDVEHPDAEPQPLPKQFTDFGYGSASYSPDGKWIAVQLY